MITQKKRILAVAAVAIAVVLVVLLLLGRTTTAESITVERVDFEEKIAAVGQLQLAKETTLVAEVNGEILSVGVSLGQEVRTGASVLVIDHEDQDFELAQQKTAYDTALADYRHLTEHDYVVAKQELAAATSAKEEATRAYDSAKQLYDQGGISQSVYLQFKTDYDNEIAQWNTATLNVQALSASGTLRSAAEANVQSAKSSYENAQNQQSKYHITVPWDALILKLYVGEQDYVRIGDSLADIGEAGTYHVLVELDEQYYPYVQTGSTATISIPSQPQEVSVGSVEQVSPKIDTETGTFSVQIALPEAFSVKASDLTVNVELLLRVTKDAIVIPKAYLMEEESCVFVYRNGKVTQVTVSYEEHFSNKLVVTAGIDSGDVLVKPGEGITDGADVHLLSEGN